MLGTYWLFRSFMGESAEAATFLLGNLSVQDFCPCGNLLNAFSLNLSFYILWNDKVEHVFNLGMQAKQILGP